MPRGPRVCVTGGSFHITARGNNKKCLFRRDNEYRYFKKLLLKYKNKFNFQLHHYVLMINHIHLSVTVSDDTNISKIMQGLELSYGHYYRRRRNYVGHLYQGRFDSRLLTDDTYLLIVGLYIERNPVDADIVRDPLEYPWSSYRYYAIGKEDPLITPCPLYIDLDKKPEKRQEEYRKLMAISIEKMREEKDVPVVSVTLDGIKK